MTIRFIADAKTWAKNIKRDVHAVWLAARDPRTPLLAKVLALIVAAYAVSPIDLIPDFIPIIGYLNDLIIVPLGIMLVVHLIPAEVMRERSAGQQTSCQSHNGRRVYRDMGDVRRATGQGIYLKQVTEH